MSLDVSLPNDERIHAAIAGVRRQESALRKGYQDKFPAKPPEAWGIHVEGAIAECALAHALNLYWSGTVGKLGLGDVGEFQVRLSGTNCLIIRPRDLEKHANDRFVFATGEFGTYQFHGWKTGKDACRDEWLKDPGGNGKAWFVPRAALEPMHTLVSARVPA